MKEKKFKEICQNIYYFFDSLNQEDGNDKGVTYGKEFPLGNVFDFFKWLEKNEENFKGEMFDEITNILMDTRSIFFAVGYTIGQSFDLIYPDAQKDIEAIKKVIREKQLLPYLPREERREP